MITITLDPGDLIAGLDAFAMRQLPYATALGLNDVAFTFQRVQQQGLERRFTLRRSTWIKQGVYFPREQRADYRTGRLSATVSIEPKRDFLTKFEQGGVKKARRALGRLAVPVDARRTKKDIVSKSERLDAFGLTISARGPKAVIGKGRKRVFSIRLHGGDGYVFRRVGRGKRSTLRLLHHLRVSTPLPKLLEFQTTAAEVARQRFAPAMADAFTKAMRTAR